MLTPKLNAADQLRSYMPLFSSPDHSKISLRRSGVDGPGGPGTTPDLAAHMPSSVTLTGRAMATYPPAISSR